MSGHPVDDGAPAKPEIDLQQVASSAEDQTTVAGSFSQPHAQATGGADTDNSNDINPVAGAVKSTSNNISTFISEDSSAKYNTSEQAMHNHDCDNTDLHEEIASLEAAIAAKQRDIGLLQQDVNRLQL